jgi:hypothetical protein
MPTPMRQIDQTQAVFETADLPEAFAVAVAPYHSGCQNIPTIAFLITRP